MEENISNRKTRVPINKTVDISHLIYGKVPPQARELEEAVLGALLIDSSVINSLTDILSPETFYVDAHGVIFQAVLELHAMSHPVDMLTVTERLRVTGRLENVGGAYYISQLTNVVASAANARYHAFIVRQKYIQREHIRIANEIMQEMYEDVGDVFEISDKYTTQLLSLTNVSVSNIKSVAQIQGEINKTILLGKPIAKIYSIGINGLDFMSKTFNIVAGYPGTGKTALMLSASVNLARQGVRVGIMSIEMSNNMLVARMIQAHNKISSKRIITGELTDEEKEMIINCERLPETIFTDDSSNITDKNILSKVKAFILKHDIEFLFIDFIQMMQIVEAKKLEVKVMEIISTALQQLAKDLDRCFVALSQLSKTTDKNEKPTYNNLRGGGIEQAASDILILYDEHFKDNDGVRWQEIPKERRGMVQVIYAKGRYSEVGNSYVYFDKPRQTMVDWDKRPDDGEDRYYRSPVKESDGSDLF